MKQETRLPIPLYLSLALFAGVLAFMLCGCSSNSNLDKASSPTPKLDKETSLKTSWGTVLQYKVNSDWESDSPMETVGLCMMSYLCEENPPEYLMIEIRDTDASSYAYSSTSTYSNWLDVTEENHSGIIASMPDVEYSDYRIQELGEGEIDGIKCRYYKQNYTMNYSDEAYSELKKSNPNSSLKQSQVYTFYIAVIKDGAHDLEISASSKELLEAFLDTLSVKW